MLTKMALAALVATVGVGAMATPASAQERGGFGGERGGFSRGHERGGEYGRRGGGFERGRGGERGWGHASYGYAPGRGYCR